MKHPIALGLLVAAALAPAAVPAGASDQEVDASLSSTIAMTAEPSSTVSGWVLSATGSNTTSGGAMTVNSNQPYTVAVTADQSRMTEYVTAAAGYAASSPKTLTTPISVVAARTGGSAATPGVAATAVVGTSSTLATGTGLGTDTYSLSLSQPTSIADPALPSGRTYHIVLTYTLTSTL